jgi:hypothetical protein
MSVFLCDACCAVLITVNNMGPCNCHWNSKYNVHCKQSWHIMEVILNSCIVHKFMFSLTNTSCTSNKEEIGLWIFGHWPRGN